MSRPAVEFTPSQVADETTMRNFRALSRVVAKLQQQSAAAASTPGRVFVETVPGVGPWDFTGLNGDEADLLGYEFELAIVDPTNDIAVRLNGDAGANYGDISGVVRNQAIVALATGGPPGGANGVVELRGAATGLARTIGCARVTSFDTTPAVAVAPGDSCWTGVAALTDISVFVLGGAAAAASAVSLFKIMKVTA